MFDVQCYLFSNYQNMMILFQLETENKVIQEEQDKFTTCFKTCGTGSPILRGGEWVSRLSRHNINVSSTFYPASPDKLAYAYPGPDLPRPGNNTIHLLLLIGRRMDWQVVNKCWLKGLL